MSYPGGSDSEDSLDVDTIYSIIGNPHKRRIITYLGEHGEASFSELKKALKVSVGNLYYNLDGLAGFVTKNEKRRYFLTEKGVKVYRWMKDSEPMLKAYMRKKPSLIDKYVVSLLVPVEAMSVFYHQRVLGAGVFIATLLAGLFTTYVTHGLLFIMEYFPYVSLPLALRIAVYLTGLVVAGGLVELAARAMGFHAPIQLDFLGALSAGLLPLYISPPLLNLAFNDPLMQSIVFRVLQVFSLGLLTAAISIYKNMPKERAFIVVFGFYYIGFFLHLLLGGLEL